METRKRAKRKQDDIDNYHILHGKSSKDGKAEAEPTSSKKVKYNSTVSETKIDPRNGLSIAQALPELPLWNILNFLNLKDLTNAQFVCKHWYTVSKSKNLWRDKVWTVHETMIQDDKYKWQPVNAPMLQHVVIPLASPSTVSLKEARERNSRVVETVLTHQKDLRSIDSDSVHWRLIPELALKFPNLQSVCVGVCKQDAVGVLESLKSCARLQHLEFGKCNFYHNCEEVSKTAALKTTKLLGEYFDSLKAVDLSYFQDDFLSQENLGYILKMKGNQLDKLKLYYTEDYTEELLNIVSQFKHLKLTLSVNILADFSVLRSLQSLNLYFHFQLDMKEISGTCLPNVQRSCVSLRKDGDLKTFAESLPSLKSLYLHKMVANNAEFLHFKDFQYLEYIAITNASFVNTEGLSHLKECPALNSLQLEGAKLDQDLIKAITLCNRLSYIEFRHCDFINNTFYKDLQYLLDSLCDLKTLVVIDCCKKGKLLTKAVLNSIHLKCTKRGVSMKTSQVWVVRKL